MFLGLCLSFIGVWCNTSLSRYHSSTGSPFDLNGYTVANGGWGCCRTRPKDIDSLENIEGFHEQYRADYDPNYNAIYNETPRVESQPMGQPGMKEAPRTNPSLGGDSPFEVRPAPDQLPTYSSRMSTPPQGNDHTSRTAPQPHLIRPPGALQPGGHRSGESHPPQIFASAYSVGWKGSF